MNNPRSFATNGPFMPNATTPVLVLDQVVRTYRQVETPLEVLRGISLTVQSGEMVALVGPSGAGKSTLLHVAGLLEKPDGGEVWVEGRPTVDLSDDGRTRLRRQSVGFVYQFHHLLPEFSALENIILPQMIAGIDRQTATAQAQRLLDMVGLSARAQHRPARLSGGEQQRVAIARALANRPGLLIADEPTGNLDQHTAADVFAMLTEILQHHGFGALVATHNLDLAARMHRVLELRGGYLAEVG